MRWSFFFVLTSVAGSTLLATEAPASAAIAPAATPAPVNGAIPKPFATFTNTGAGAAASGTFTNGAALLGTSVSGNCFDAGGFGATFLVSGIAPYYGAVGFGAEFGLFGQVEFAGTGSSSGTGVIGRDDIGTASSGDYNIGVLGKSTYRLGVPGASSASPQISMYGESPVGVYAVARTAGTPDGNAFAFFGETDSFGIDLHSTNSGNSFVYVVSQGSLFQGYGSSGSVNISTAGNESLSRTLTTSEGTTACT